MSLNDDFKLILQAGFRKTGFMGAYKPGDGTKDFPLTRAAAAYELNKAGDRLIYQPADFPRMTWSDNACPAYLFEPARTNLITWSEDFTNAAWNKVSSIITPNAIIAPDGTLTADKLIATAVNTNHRVEQATSVASSAIISVFAKAGEYHFIQLHDNFSGLYQNFNLDTGTLGNGALTGCFIDDLGGGWYRCGYFRNGPFNISRVFVLNADTAAASPSFLGDGTSGVYIWGAQTEVGQTATSYIPTTGTTVTRPADVSTRTDLQTGGYLGATSGAFYIDMANSVFESGGGLQEVYVHKANLNGFLLFQNTSASLAPLSVRKLISGVQTTLFTPSTSPANIRYLITWNGATLDVYMNGTKVVDATAAVFADPAFNTFAINGAQARKEIRTIAFSDVIPTEAQAVAVSGFANLDEYLGFINYTSDNPALYESYT